MKTTKKLLSKSVITSLAALLLPLGAQATADDAQKMHKLYEEIAPVVTARTMAVYCSGLNSETLKAAAPQLYALLSWPAVLTL